MKLANHLPTAKTTNSVTNGAAPLAPQFVQVFQPRNCLRSFHFVEVRSIKKAPAITTLFVSIIRFVLSCCHPSDRTNAMQADMIRLRNYFKVLNRIIKLVPIFMMNNLLRKWKEFTTKMFFHYHSMLVVSDSVHLEHFITTPYRSFSVKCSSIIGISVSKLPLKMKATQALREVFSATVWNRTNSHHQMPSPFDLPYKHPLIIL